MKMVTARKQGVATMSMASSKVQGGVSLIEILIATAIFSIGLVSLLALQNNAFKISNEGYFRTQAAIVAAGIIDTIAAHAQIGFDTTDADNITKQGLLQDLYLNINWQQGVETGQDCLNLSNDFCDKQETVNYNSDLFKQQVSAVLPDGKIAMYQCGGDNQFGFCLAISWQEVPVADCYDGDDSNDDKCYIQFIGI